LVSKTAVYNVKLSKLYRAIYTFLSQKWHFDHLANNVITVGTMNFGYRSSFQLIDKGNIELFAPMGASYYLQLIIRNFAGIQSGFVSNYALTFIIAISIMIAMISIVFLYNSILFIDGYFLLCFFGYLILRFVE